MAMRVEADHHFAERHQASVAARARRSPSLADLLDHIAEAGDRLPGLRVEEVQCPLVDDDVGALTLRHPRPGTEPAHKRGLVRTSSRGEPADGAVVTDVLREFADILGDRLRRGDREVHEHLRPERLAQLDPAAKPGRVAVR